MTRAILPYLLILLLATAWVDDAVAAATPDPADDLLALQDNEYLPAAARPCTRSCSLDSLPPEPVPPTLARPGLTSAARLSPAGPRPAGPPLVYVLLTLRR